VRQKGYDVGAKGVYGRALLRLELGGLEDLEAWGLGLGAWGLGGTKVLNLRIFKSQASKPSGLRCEPLQFSNDGFDQVVRG